MGDSIGAGRRELAANGTLAARAGRRGLRVRCRRGTCAVTREGDRSDYVLHAGAVFEVRAPGLLVVWALTPAAVELERPPRAGLPTAFAAWRRLVAGVEAAVSLIRARAG
ncbi:MAG: DUF2917 domain-containing protein [Thermodesulfobacteriota bacterium]